MDQTTPAHQGLLRLLRKRRQNPDLDRHRRVYVLVAIARKRLGINTPLYSLVQLLSLNLYEQTTIPDPPATR
jgi:hypothetical protein